MNTYFYSQSTGAFTNAATAALLCRGYSGFGDSKNVPADQDKPDFGPIPRGYWTVGAAEDHPKLGPLALPLLPDEGTDTFGRSAFFAHGDSIENPGTASHGCLILPKSVRLLLATGDKIEVTL